MKNFSNIWFFFSFSKSFRISTKEREGVRRCDCSCSIRSRSFLYEQGDTDMNWVTKDRVESWDWFWWKLSPTTKSWEVYIITCFLGVSHHDIWERSLPVVVNCLNHNLIFTELLQSPQQEMESCFVPFIAVQIKELEWCLEAENKIKLAWFFNFIIRYIRVKLPFPSFYLSSYNKINLGFI